MKRFAAAVMLVVIAACGQRPVDAAMDRELQDRAARVRAAVVAGNVSLALKEIEALRNASESFMRLGVLSADRAQRILAASELVIQGLPLLTPPEPASSPSPEEEIPPSETREDDEKGEGNKGRGKGHGDRDD